MAMPDNELPSKEQLAKLPIEAIRIYASRCALRVLPFTLGEANFDYIKSNNKKASVAGISIATMFGFFDTDISIDDIDAAANTSFNAAASVDDGTVYAAANAATQAAKAAKATDTDSAAVYAAGSYNAISAIHNNPYVAYSKADFDALNNELALDFNDLKQGIEVQFYGLWRAAGNPTPNLNHNMILWFNALRDLELSDYIFTYEQLLEGHPNPRRIISRLINQWKQKYKPELESEFDSSIKKGAVKPPKLKKGKEDKNKEAPKQPPVIDLRGHLSIKSELASEVDHLGRDRLVDALAELLTHKDQKDPLTIGLLGDWGAGKTTVLNLLEKRLAETSLPHYSVKVFNAWSYEHTENIQAGVAQEAILAMTETTDGFWRKLFLPLRLSHKLNKTKLYGYLAILVIWFGIIIFLAINGRFKTVLEMGLGFSLSLLFLYNALKPLFSHPIAKAFTGFLKLPDYTSHVGQLPVYQQQVEALSELCLGEDERLLFIVDDLDRCSPDGIVKVFEAIRLVMEIEKVTVIIAIDHRIALSALAHHYKNLADDINNTDSSGENNGECRSKYDIARDYLGKIIQLPVNLGRPDQEMVDNYVSYLFKGTMYSEAGFDDISANNIDYTNKPNQQEIDQSKDQPTLANQATPETVKIDTEARAKLETPKEPEPNQTMQHSLAEKTRFSELTDALDLHNPRQLKRLYSSYRLLRAYAKRDEAQNLKIMTTLFWLEQKYSQAVNHSHYHQGAFEELIIELNDSKVNGKVEMTTNPTLAKLAKHFDDQTDYLSYKKLVKPFVLPQARQ